MTAATCIMFDSPEAAHPGTVDGWISRDGYFYQDERTARYAGCTHRPCEDCGEATEKMYTNCESCRKKHEDARYMARPEAQWDGVQMVYSESRQEFYSSPEDAEDDMDNGGEIAGLRIVLCDPQYIHQIDTDYWCDDLPEDGEAPDELLAAIDAFNAATAGIVLSWYPGKMRLINEEAEKVTS
jgi:hypothetical protein